jgi:hypothetical protein
MLILLNLSERFINNINISKIQLKFQKLKIYANISLILNKIKFFLL